MKRILALSLVTSVLVAAEKPLTPEYRLSFADAGQVKKLLDANDWAKELQQSNLYRGLLLRLAPALFSLDEKPEPTWQGRLVDFIVDKIARKKRLSIFYYHYPGLVSPFGALLQDLGDAEQAAAKLLVSRFQPTKATVEIDKVAVLPLSHKFQKFAAVLGSGCLSLSRDPRVAAAISRQCGQKTGGDGATLDVDLKEFYPSWFALLDRLFGIGRRAEIDFRWESSGARFVPHEARVALGKGHLLGAGKIPEKLLAALPAETQLLAVGFLPDPGQLGIEGVTSYLRGPKKGTSVPIAVAHLGMKLDGAQKARAMTVVLVPQKEVGNQLFQDVEELFSEKGYYEVRYRRGCGELLALSPSEAALDLVEQSCAGKRPSLKQAPPGFVKALTENDVSAGLYLNPATLLASSMDFGWEVGLPPPPKAEVDQPAPERPVPPTELADAKSLVGKLPSILFAGKADDNALKLSGATP